LSDSCGGQRQRAYVPLVPRAAYFYSPRRPPELRNFQNCHPCELGLEKYVQGIVERLQDGIVPDESEGEAPLMPITNRYEPIGTTAEVDFKTTRACHATMKSHIDPVVVDNLVRESSAGLRLEASDAVRFYARNHYMSLTLPYEYMGIDHAYEPDFLVRLTRISHGPAVEV